MEAVLEPCFHLFIAAFLREHGNLFWDLSPTAYSNDIKLAKWQLGFGKISFIDFSKFFKDLWKIFDKTDLLIEVLNIFMNISYVSLLW